MIGFAPIGNSIAIDFEGQQPTGGDISSSGREIVLRTYHNIYYWHRHPMTSVMETLRRRPIKIERIHDEACQARTQGDMDPGDLRGRFILPQSIRRELDPCLLVLMAVRSERKWTHMPIPVLLARIRP